MATVPANYRIVKTPFVLDGRLYGPGRFAFGNKTYSWWVTGNTIEDDGVTPPGHSEVIQVDGLARAYDRLHTWQRNNNP